MQQWLGNAEGTQRSEGFEHPGSQPEPRSFERAGMRALRTNRPGQQKIESEHEGMNRQRHRSAGQCRQRDGNFTGNRQPGRQQQCQQHLSDQHRALDSSDHWRVLNDAAIIGRF